MTYWIRTSLAMAHNRHSVHSVKEWNIWIDISHHTPVKCDIGSCVVVRLKMVCDIHFTLIAHLLLSLSITFQWKEEFEQRQRDLEEVSQDCV